jgi:hypothetical protein
MTRLARAWAAMSRERRIAALTALGLFASMFLPWYSKTVVEGAKANQASQSAFMAFSFVEAAVLLVSAGILAALIARAEGRDFRLPGGDGTIVMVAGGWAAALIFYRMLDKPTLQGTQKITATVGVEWGIFIALLLALGLLYAGRRIRYTEHTAPAPARRRRSPQLASSAYDYEPDEPEVGAPIDPTPPRPSTPASARTAPAAGERGVLPAAEQPTGREGGRDSDSRETRIVTPRRAAPATPAGARSRPRYPPGPAEQLSFEDPPQRPE